MFLPEITSASANNNKPKTKTKKFDEEMLKQCQTALKQIQVKSKKVAKSNIPSEYISDFNKVCHLKDIPSFYAHYFFTFIHKSEPEFMANAFAQEIQNLMSSRAHYHKISASVKQRSVFLNSLKESVVLLFRFPFQVTVEGFSLMNSGKNVPLAIKSQINELIKDCTSLEQVKSIEKAQIEKFADDLVNVRNNLKAIIDSFEAWQGELKGFDGSAKPSFQKIKVVFPQQGINCPLHGLFDTKFLKESFLKNFVKFSTSTDKDDPFFMHFEITKKTPKMVEQVIVTKLLENSLIYETYERKLEAINPRINISKLEEEKLKKMESREISKSRKSIRVTTLEKDKSKNKLKPKEKLKNESLKEQYLNEKMTSESIALKGKIESIKKLIDIDEIDKLAVYRKGKKSSRKSIPQSPQKNISKNLSITLIGEREVYVQEDTRNSSKINRPKSMANINQQQIEKSPTSKDKGIKKIYQNKKSRNSEAQYALNRSLDKSRSNDSDAENRELLKNIKKEKDEKEKLKKIIEKVEKRTSSENKYYQQKMEKYEEQISRLKNKFIEQTRDKIEKKLYGGENNNSPIYKKNTDKDIFKVYNKSKQQKNGVQLPEKDNNSYVFEEVALREKTKQQDQPKTESLKLKESQNEKKQLLRQIQRQKAEQQKLKKIVQKVQKRTQSENRFYDQKMQNYQLEISQLKQKIQKRQENRQQSTKGSPSRPSNYWSTKQKGEKNLDVLKIYQTKSAVSKQQPKSSMGFIDEQSVNSRMRQLENQVKELTKEKLKIQQLSQKQGGKINKEKQLYERRLQKYEQTIQKLKAEANQNKKIVKELEIKYKSKLQESSLNNRISNVYGNSKNNSLMNNKSSVLKKQSFDVYVNLEELNKKKKEKSIQQQEAKVKKSLSNTISHNNTKQGQETDQVDLTKTLPQEYGIRQSAKKDDSNNDLKIFKGNNMIEIVYNPKRKSKNKTSNPSPIIKQEQRAETQLESIPKKSLSNSRHNYQHQQQVLKLEQQKQLLEKKLQQKSTHIHHQHSNTEASLLRKLETKDNQIEKYKQLIQKQKETHHRYDQRMKEMKKKLNQEYETKLFKEKEKFEQQKEFIFYKLKEEKQSKIEKERNLSKQVLFLKEMQMREQQLMDLLEKQRLEKLQKEEELQERLREKQEQLELYEIEEIKKTIEQQIRAQMRLNDDDEDSADDYEGNSYNKAETFQSFEAKKARIQSEMESLVMGNHEELEEIGQQNERLKELIAKIKEEESRVAANLQAQVDNSELDDETPGNDQSQILSRNEQIPKDLGQNLSSDQKRRGHESEGQISKRLEKSDLSKIQLQSESQFEKNESLLAELKHKTQLQLQKEAQTSKTFKNLQQSPGYRERQKIENIIKHYLNNKPHQYPQNHSIDMKPQQKEHLVSELLQKNKQAQEFEQQLMRIKNVQKFVPAQRDDALTSHMLNLREVYQNEEAQALKQVLFPPMEPYNRELDGQEIHELSYESDDTPPPVTLRDHTLVYEKEYDEEHQKKQQKNKGKNFLSINRMRLMQIEEERKEKQRARIEEESQKKIKKFKSRHKKNMMTIEQQIKASKQAIKTKIEQPTDENKKEETVPTHQEKKQQKGDSPRFIELKEKLESKNTDFEMLEDKKAEDLPQKATEGIKRQPKQKDEKSSEKNPATNQGLDSASKNNIVPDLKLKTQQSQQSNILGLSEIKPIPPVYDLSHSKAINGQRKQQSDEQEYQDDFNQFLAETDGFAETKKQNEQTQGEGLKHQGEQSPDKKSSDQQKSQLSEDEENQYENEFLMPQQKNLENKQSVGPTDNKESQQPQEQQLEPQYQAPSQNIALMKLQQQKSVLKSDILSYQDEIRSYINQEPHYEVYQHHIPQEQTVTYFKQLTEQLSSEEIFQLNSNPTLLKDVQQSFESVLILIAKDPETHLELGIGVFHKQYQLGEWVCDYLLAHNMKNFLNLTFNFSRFITEVDEKYCQHVEFIFKMDALKDQISKLHFSEFETRCKRMGEIYVKSRNLTERKYVLRRNLFVARRGDQVGFDDYENIAQGEQTEHRIQCQQGKGIKFTNKIQIHENLMKQRNKGFVNSSHPNHCSFTVLLSNYIKSNAEEFTNFKKRSEGDLNNREILVTSLVFEKKQFSLKGITSNFLDTQNKLTLYKDILFDKFIIDDVQQQVQETKFCIEQSPPSTVKRCILSINQQQIKYCMMKFANEPLNQIQASNSSQIGTFLPILPKYKVLVLPAEEFLTSSRNNPDLNVFFYVKHFMKNITEVKKQTFSRVYVPEVYIKEWTFNKDLSQKMNRTVFGQQAVQIGWKSHLNNSVVYTPTHKDLVIEKPFIISVLSANVERVIDGSPIFCKVIF